MKSKAIKKQLGKVALHLFYAEHGHPTARGGVLLVPDIDAQESQGEKMSVKATVRDKWVSSSEGINLILEGNLAKLLKVGKFCHLSVGEGSTQIQEVTGTLLRHTIANALELDDTLSLRMDVPSNDVSTNDHLFVAEVQPLALLIDITTQCVRVHKVEYLTLACDAEDINIVFTPEKNTTTKQLKQWITNGLDGLRASNLLCGGKAMHDEDKLSKHGVKHQGRIEMEVERLSECSTCSSAFSVTSVGGAISPQCKHDRTTCAECLSSWLEEQLTSLGWDGITCAECSAKLQLDDMRKHASKDTFANYERLSTRAALSEIPGFRWCLSPEGCDAGQIHVGDDEQPIFTCTSCRHQHCIMCSRPWHSGETCEQYVQRIEAIPGIEQASEEYLRKETKQCPECRSNIEKNGGCEHMTCFKCRHEFCWSCLADYRAIMQHGNARHASSCPYNSNNLPAMDPDAPIDSDDDD